MSARRTRVGEVAVVLAVLLAAACAPLPRGTAAAVPGTSYRSVDPVVNVARGKPIRANVTCGSPLEDFYPHSDSVKPPPNRQLQICDASDPVLAHNASLMLDGNSSTWWQSTSLQQLMLAGNGIGNQPEVYITLDLGETYHPENITIHMGDTKRPGRLAVLRSADGLTYNPWLYLVTNGNRDCRRFGVAEQPEPASPESVVCREYARLGVEPLYNERITVSLMEVPPSFSDEDVLSWQAVRHLQLHFYDMDLVLGIFEDQFHHYAVSEVSVMAGCGCNGFGNGCEISAESGQYECICSGNTQGAHCEECQPMYNQFPYQPGQPCQACNCNNHSEACVYNETVAAGNQSLAANGSFHGGGVCLSCHDNTSGINCERCDTRFYMNPEVSHQSSSACLPCGCDLTGSSVLQCNMTTGQCPCKPGVGGRMCNVCLPGYYNFTSGGCTPCPCYPLQHDTPCHMDQGGHVMCNCTQGHEGEQCESCGEFYWGDPVSGAACTECDCSGNSDQCNNITGECIGCRDNTTSFNCERCADGFYGDAIFGNCSVCACDAAGSVDLVCNHTTGLCPCKPGVDTSTRRCSSCMENYYGFDTPDGHGNDSQPGCSACNCNDLGSTSLQCGEWGNCSCEDGVEGNKCDMCMEGTYGLPDMSCRACDCDLVGTDFDPHLPATTQSALGQTTMLGLTTTQDATEETTIQDATVATTNVTSSVTSDPGPTEDTTVQIDLTTDTATTVSTTNDTTSATDGSLGTTDVTTALPGTTDVATVLVNTNNMTAQTETTDIATSLVTTNATSATTPDGLGTTDVTVQTGTTDIATVVTTINNATAQTETTDIATSLVTTNATSAVTPDGLETTDVTVQTETTDIATAVGTTNNATVQTETTDIAATVATTDTTTDGLGTTGVTTDMATDIATTNDTLVTTELVTSTNGTDVAENVTTVTTLGTTDATAVHTPPPETNTTDNGTRRLVEEGFQARQRRQLPDTSRDNTQQNTTVSTPPPSTGITTTLLNTTGSAPTSHPSISTIPSVSTTPTSIDPTRTTPDPNPTSIDPTSTTPDPTHTSIDPTSTAPATTPTSSVPTSTTTATTPPSSVPTSTTPATTTASSGATNTAPVTTPTSSVPTSTTPLTTPSSSVATYTAPDPTPTSSVPTSTTTATTPPSSVPTSTTPATTTASSGATNTAPVTTPTSSVATITTPVTTLPSSVPTNTAPVTIPTSSVPTSAMPVTTPSSSVFTSTAHDPIPTSSVPTGTTPVTTPPSSVFTRTAPVTTPTSSVPTSTAPDPIPTPSVPTSTAPVTTPPSTVPTSTAPVTMPTSSVPTSTAPVTTPPSSVPTSTTPDPIPTSSVPTSTAPVTTLTSSVPTSTAPVTTLTSSVPTSTTPVTTPPSSVPTSTAPVTTTTSSVPTSTAPGSIATSSVPTSATPDPIPTPSVPTSTASVTTPPSTVPTSTAPVTTPPSSVPTSTAPGPISTSSVPTSTAPATTPPSSVSTSAAPDPIPTPSVPTSTASVTTPPSTVPTSTAPATTPPSSVPTSATPDPIPTPSVPTSTAPVTTPPSTVPTSTAPVTTPPSSVPTSTAPVTIPTPSVPTSTAPGPIPTSSVPTSTAPVTTPPSSVPTSATPDPIPTSSVPTSTAPGPIPTSSVPTRTAPVTTPPSTVPTSTTPDPIPTSSVPTSTTPATTPPSSVPTSTAPVTMHTSSVPTSTAPATTPPSSVPTSTTPDPIPTPSVPTSTAPVTTPPSSVPTSTTPATTTTSSVPTSTAPGPIPTSSVPTSATPDPIPTSSVPTSTAPVTTLTSSVPTSTAPVTTLTSSVPTSTTPVTTPPSSVPTSTAPVPIPTSSVPTSIAPATTPTSVVPTSTATPEGTTSAPVVSTPATVVPTVSLPDVTSVTPFSGHTTTAPPAGTTPAPGTTIFPGLVPSNHTCQRTTGQCRCKPGVGGWSCNVCLPMFHGFGPSGCSGCPACEQTLHQFLAETESDWDHHWGMAEEVNTLQMLDTPLQDISVVIETVQQDLNESALDLGDVNETVSNLTGELPELNRTAEDLHNQVSVLFPVARQQLNSSSMEYMRLEQLKRKAQDMLNNATAANQTAFAIIHQLNENKASARKMLLQADELLGNLTAVSFDDLGQQSQAVLTMAGNESQAAHGLNTTVYTEVQEAAALQGSLTTAQTLLSNVSSTMDSTKLTANLILTTAENVGQHLTTANRSRQQVAVLVHETASLLSDAETALQAADLVLQNATQDFEQAKTLLNGESGWTATAAEVTRSSNQTAAQLTALTAAVQKAEAYSANLTAQADAVDSVFQAASLQGQSAVNAIRGYEEVALLLNESVSIATEVNATVQNLTEYIQSISIATLEGRANQSLAASLVLQEEIEGKNMSTAGLLQEVRLATASVSAAQTEWGHVTTQLQQLERDLQGTEAAAQEGDIVTSLEEGFQLVERAANQSTTAGADITGVSSGVEGVRGHLVVIQETSDNVTTIVTDLEQTVSGTNQTLQTFLQQVQNVSQLRAEADTTQAQLEQRMAELQRKMLQLEQAVQRLNTPMNFDGNTSTMLEPPTSRSPVFSSIAMDTRVGQLNGSAVLLYGENHQTGEFLLVTVEDEHVTFSFKVSGDQQEPIRVDSNLRLCNNCWYHVQATRYRNEGMLTVTDLDTLAATSVQATDTEVTGSDLTLTSDFYVGGLPLGVQVAQSGRYGRFVGCVANLEVNQQIQNLWTTPFPINGTPSCCQHPPSSTNLQPGVSFDGFGYLMLSNQNFPINSRSQMSLQFRTFNRHAVILLVEGEREYYGLFLEGGHLVFQLENSGINPWRENVTSDLTYNDGTWYEVTVSALPGVSVSLVTRNVNSDSVYENKTAESRVVLVGGGVQIVLVGSQHPNQTNSVGPTSVKFAGCLHDVRLNNRRVQLNTSSSSAAVNFQGCLPQIVPGVGFQGDNSFSQLAVALDFSGAAEIRFQLKPGELDGVLIYAEDTTDTESFFYLALYNGHLFGVHQPAQGQPQVLRPSSSLLVDQQWHLVEFNITAGSISVQVDGNDGALTSVLSGTLSSVHLYLAGVGPALQEKLDRCEVCPVVDSYTGGMQGIWINGRELDFWDPATVLSQRGVYLSGLDPPQNATAPTLPPPGPTVAPPSCADPFQPTYSREGVNFGRHGNSFMSYNLPHETMTQYFRTSFVLTCQFRAEAPEGILYYSANNERNPDNYLALYMRAGYLIADMKTQQPGNGDYHNLRVQTKFRDYADGNWWEVVILRIHNFLAIIVPERRDYVNNNQQSNTETLIDLTLPFYIGGTDIRAEHPVFPLPIKMGFAGCIRLLEISTARPVDTVTFDLESPDNEYGASQCYEAVHPGTAFNGTGFATMGGLDGTGSLESGLDVSVMFSTVQRSFVLLLLYQDPGNYFLMDAEDGRIRGHLRKNNITTTIRTTHVETGYEICDRVFHTVVFSANLVPRVGMLLLSIQLDQLAPNQVRQTGFDDISIHGELYVGGAPVAASLVSPGLTQRPFRGCLESLVFAGETLDFRQAGPTEHVTSGCPARP